MNKSICIVLCITALFLSGYKPEQAPSKQGSLDISQFPVPPQTDELLFYLQLSVNTNTVIYEINFTPDKVINPHDPVNIYWINYSTDGKRSELSYIQKTVAYGIDSRFIKGKEGAENSYTLKIISYKKRLIYIVKSQTGKYYAYTVINKKISRFKHIFVEIDGGTFWFPNVKCAILYGEDLQTKEVVSEKIMP